MNKQTMKVHIICIEAFPSYLFFFFRSSKVESEKERKSVERMRYEIYSEKEKNIFIFTEKKNFKFMLHKEMSFNF